MRRKMPPRTFHRLLEMSADPGPGPAAHGGCRALAWDLPFAVLVLLLTLCAFGIGAEQAVSEERTPAMRRVYTHLMDPRAHPDYDRRHVRPPSWDAFDNRTRFATLRGFGVDDGQIVHYVEEIEKYTRAYGLGDVLWPSYPIVFAENLGDLADEIRQRGLFLFDIWGYVPGSGPGGYWQQYKPPAEVFDLLESKLGDHWLGMDVGEQDGRYIGGYAPQMHPISGNRFEQYLNFQRHFQHMCDELGNKMSTLVSLNFGHHFLKEGVYATIGAETAQALPNGQVYYAFIRGAGKQYGVPWFGNASVWNRWGWKTYGAQGDSNGPTKGTSLNLLKRLMYNHILYNCVFVGFEASWFEGDQLSPVGRIQQAARNWVAEHGQPGVMHTPVALLTDFFAGWSFPRHLYTGNVYRVWGNLPYEAGDYLTDGVLDLFYPGYQDASYFHNESGFITPTPYGDAADCLLSDAPPWLLARYPVLVAAGWLAGGLELRDKLAAYVEAGGHLLVTAANLAKFDDGLGGIAVTGPAVRFPAGQGIEAVAETVPFELWPLSLPEGARVLARCGDMPAAVQVGCGKGNVTVLASPFGIGCEPAVNTIPNQVDQPFLTPYPLLNHVRSVLDAVFREQALFEVGEGLSLITCRKTTGEYTLGICNNALEQRPFEIVSRCGEVESIAELSLDQSDKEAAGYLPEGFEAADIGTSGGEAIAGGDVRVFRVKVREQGVEEIPHAAPPARPRGRALPLRGNRPIKEEVLARPTFFEHFDAVVVDWRYIHQRDTDALENEAGWIARQGLRVYVDLTSGINLYPDLRLVNNIEEDYAASRAAILDVIDKMQALGAHDLILSLHRTPENNISREQTWASFEDTLRALCAQAAERGTTLYLRTSSKAGASPNELMPMIDRIAAPNLLLAPSIALLLHHKADPDETANVVKDKLGLWLLSAPDYDVAGALWTTNTPIAERVPPDTLAPLLAIAPDAPILLDAVYANQDREYLDARALARLAPQ